MLQIHTIFFLEEVKNFILLRGSDEGKISKLYNILMSIGVGGQAVLGRQNLYSTPWLTERHGFGHHY